MGGDTVLCCSVVSRPQKMKLPELLINTVSLLKLSTVSSDISVVLQFPPISCFHPAVQSV